MPTPIITLTTDFGASFYVGQLKGVLASLAPTARVIDLTHEIEPQAVVQGSVILQDSLPWFPRGSIHIAVVDPGVGTERAILAMEANGMWIIGPDNGLLAPLADDHPPSKIYRVTNGRFWPTGASNTFHGRDIMAPVAAHLALGGTPEELGEPVQKIAPARFEPPMITPKEILGETLFPDRYGNLISSLRINDFDAERVGKISMRRIDAEKEERAQKEGTVARENNREEEIRFVKTYNEGSPREVIALIGSNGRLELSVNSGNAAKQLGTAKMSVKILLS